MSSIRPGSRIGRGAAPLPGTVLWLALSLCVPARSEPNRAVLVITSSKVEAYAWAVGEIRSGITHAGGTVSLFDGADRGMDRLQSVIARVAPALIIAVGTEAVRGLKTVDTDIPVIVSMVLETASPKDENEMRGRTIRVLPLDVPPRTVFQSLKRLFPGRPRIGIIRNPNRNEPAAAVLKEQAHTAGMSAEVAECARAEDVVPVFNQFAGAVDFVWLFPDSSLYNSITVRPLVTSSLRSRLPIIGFSESFAKSGAAFAIYPDFRSIGVKTGEAAARFLRGQPLGDNPPGGFRMAVNRTILRMIGLASPMAMNDAEVLDLP